MMGTRGICLRVGCRNAVGPRHRFFCSGDCSQRSRGDGRKTHATEEAGGFLGLSADQLIAYVRHLEDTVRRLA